MNVFGSVIAGACGTALSILGALLAGVTTIVTGIIETIQGIITFVTGPFTGDWSAGWKGVQQIFSGIWDVIKGIIESTIGILGSLADSVKGLLGLGGEKSPARCPEGRSVIAPGVAAWYRSMNEAARFWISHVAQGSILMTYRCRWQRHLRGSRSAFQNLPIPLWLERMQTLTVSRILC